MADAAARPEALLGGFDLLLLDLDGVVYVGADAVPGAVDALAAAAAAGVGRAFTTNNASRPPQEVAAQLVGLGVPARVEEVTTSSQAAALLVRERLGVGARVLPVGGPGVRAALLEHGAVPVAVDGDPQAVVQGFGRDVGWRDLADAAAAVRGGALWVATNTDRTLPTERGPAPGNGTLVAAVGAAAGVEPLVAGKPQPGLFRAATARAGAQRPLVVGDRLDTDVAGAVAAGVPGLLVLTGLSTPRQVLAAPPGQRPDHLAADLSGLHELAAAAVRDGGAWTCGRARAEVRDGRVSAGHGTGGGTAAGTADLLDLLRAASAAAWAAADEGAAPDGSGAGAAPEPDDALGAALDALGARCAHRPR